MTTFEHPPENEPSRDALLRACAYLQSIWDREDVRETEEQEEPEEQEGVR